MADLSENRRNQWNTPAQSFTHELNPLKGWPSPYALDKTGELIDNSGTIYAGRVMHIDSTTGKFAIGCPWSSTVASMPLFAFPNSTDYDVLSDVGNFSGSNMLGLVGLGAYELESTEYVGTGFTSGVPLTVDNTGTPANYGCLIPTTLTTTDLIVGIVSDNGPITNEWGKTVLRFWPTYLPYRTGAGGAASQP